MKSKSWRWHEKSSKRTGSQSILEWSGEQFQEKERINAQRLEVEARRGGRHSTGLALWLAPCSASGESSTECSRRRRQIVELTFTSHCDMLCWLRWPPVQHSWTSFACWRTRLQRSRPGGCNEQLSLHSQARDSACAGFRGLQLNLPRKANSKMQRPINKLLLLFVLYMCFKKMLDVIFQYQVASKRMAALTMLSCERDWLQEEANFETSGKPPFRLCQIANKQFDDLRIFHPTHRPRGAHTERPIDEPRRKGPSARDFS